RGPDDTELQRARSLIRARRLRRLETMEGKASHLAEWQSLGDWRMGDSYTESVLQVGAEGARDAIRRHLSLDAMSVVTCLPTDAPQLASGADAVRSALDGGRPVVFDPVPHREPVAAPVLHLAPREERTESGVRVFRTGRGLPLLVMERPGAPVTHAGLFTLGGARDEGAGRAGLTKLMVRTALKGTTTRGASRLAEDIELLGGTLSGSAGADSFGWSISVPGTELSSTLEILTDVALHPVFDEDVLE